MIYAQDYKGMSAETTSFLHQPTSEYHEQSGIKLATATEASKVIAASAAVGILITGANLLEQAGANGTAHRLGVIAQRIGVNILGASA